MMIHHRVDCGAAINGGTFIAAMRTAVYTTQRARPNTDREGYGHKTGRILYGTYVSLDQIHSRA